MGANGDARGGAAVRRAGGVVKTAIDWAAKPAPWCFIGPAFRDQVERILGRNAAPPGAHAGYRRRPVQRAADQGENQPGGARAPRRMRPHTISHLCSGTSTASAELWAKIDAVLSKAGG